MQNTLAKWISIILHPLLMPTIGVIIFLNSGLHISYFPWEIKKLIYLMVFLGTFLIPVSLIPFFLYRKIIFNVEMKGRKERFLPMFITTIFYFFTYYIFVRIQVSHILQLFILASAISVMAGFLTTLKWKISAHLIGIGGLTGGVIALAFKYYLDLELILMILFLVTGLLAWARLKLNSHNQAQVYAGYFTGLIIMLLTILLG